MTEKLIPFNLEQAVAHPETVRVLQGFGSPTKDICEVVFSKIGLELQDKKTVFLHIYDSLGFCHSFGKGGIESTLRVLDLTPIKTNFIAIYESGFGSPFFASLDNAKEFHPEAIGFIKLETRGTDFEITKL